MLYWGEMVLLPKYGDASLTAGKNFERTLQVANVHQVVKVMCVRLIGVKIVHQVYLKPSREYDEAMNGPHAERHQLGLKQLAEWGAELAPPVP